VFSGDGPSFERDALAPDDIARPKVNTGRPNADFAAPAAKAPPRQNWVNVARHVSFLATEGSPPQTDVLVTRHGKKCQ
jgi:hypothetical protein